MSNDSETRAEPNAKKQILLNAFDMSTVGHLSPGQWKVSITLSKEELNLTTLRIQRTNPQPSENWIIGSIWQSYSNVAISMHYFWQTRMGDMIHMRIAWTTASDEQRNGP